MLDLNSPLIPTIDRVTAIAERTRPAEDPLWLELKTWRGLALYRNNRTDEAIAELKKELTAAQKELAILKSSTDAEVKKALTKADGLQKEIDKLSAAVKAATTKAELEAISKKADELATEVTALKGAGGDAKTAAEKVATIEKGSEEIKKTAEKGVGDAGSALTTGKQRGDTAWILTASAFVMLKSGMSSPL